MKYLVLVTWLSLMMTTSTVASSRCRETMYQSGNHISHRDLIEKDLLSNRWEMKNQEGNTLYDFQSQGLVSQVLESVAGDFLYREYLWQLHSIGEQVFLHLTTPQSDESQIFVVRQNCQGLVLTEVNEQNHYKLDYLGPKRTEAAEILYNDLPGMWQNINEGSQWYFAPGGSIQQSGLDGNHTQKGFYFLIMDGKYLVVNHQQGHSTLFRINSTDFGYLDLSQQHQDTRLMLEKTTFTQY